jgi:hypothetical protein
LRRWIFPRGENFARQNLRRRLGHGSGQNGGAFGAADVEAEQKIAFHQRKIAGFVVPL